MLSETCVCKDSCSTTSVDTMQGEDNCVQQLSCDIQYFYCTFSISLAIFSFLLAANFKNLLLLLLFQYFLVNSIISLLLSILLHSSQSSPATSVLPRYISHSLATLSSKNIYFVTMLDLLCNTRCILIIFLLMFLLNSTNETIYHTWYYQFGCCCSSDNVLFL